MAKIGILTFQYPHNYGAVLQAHALRSYLSQLKHDVTIIPYRPQAQWERYAMNPLCALRKKQWGNALRMVTRINQAGKFAAFQRNSLGLGKPVKALSQCEGYDLAIVGSDQVWNEELVEDVGAYLLRDIPAAKKASYAASFGWREPSEAMQQQMKKYLSAFEKIAVRERRGMEIIQKATGLLAEHVCDPVFLLSAETWRKLYQEKEYRRVRGPYVLYISLRDDAALRAEAQKAAREMNLPLYVIHPTCWKLAGEGMTQLYDVGPMEYLRLVDQASCVVTNSFHAAAFTCIFGGKLVHGAQGALGGRVEDLLYTLGCAGHSGVMDMAKVDRSELNGLIAESKAYLACLAAPME